MTFRAIVAERRIDGAMVEEAQVVSAVAIVAARRGRPIVAVAANTVKTALEAVAITRSRIPSF